MKHSGAAFWRITWEGNIGRNGRWRRFSRIFDWMVMLLCLAVPMGHGAGASAGSAVGGSDHSAVSPVAYGVSEWSQVGYGAFPVSPQSPIPSIRAGLIPGTSPKLPTGAYELYAGLTAANTWINGDQAYRLDYESLNTRLSIAYAWIPNVRIELHYDNRAVFGGVLDGIVDGFHHATGFDSDGRDAVPYGEVGIDMDGPGSGDVHIQNESGIYSQSLAAVWRQTLSPGGIWKPSFSYSLTARWDVDGSRYMERDFPIDLGGAISFAKKLGDWYLFMETGVFWYGADRFGNIELTSSAVSGLLGVEYLLSPNGSLVFQYMVTEGQAKHIDAFSDPSHEVMLGVKWRVASQTLLEAAILENIIVYSNSPDFGLHVGLTRRF